MGGSMGGSGETSDGSYSVGDTEATTTDDGTYLRGAQTTDANGIAHFTTIFPGWYMGRTTHIHVKVHIDKKTVLTSQTFFDETLLDEVYSQSPYSEHTGRENNTNNASDGIYDDTGLSPSKSSRTGPTSPSSTWVSTPEVGARSAADVYREVLSGECGAVGDELLGSALEDDPTAVVTGTRAEVDDPVCVCHHRLVVLDHDD